MRFAAACGRGRFLLRRSSRNSGSVKLVKKLARKRQQCEDLEYTVRSGGPPVYTEHYRFISCLQPDGTRKIA